MYQDLNCLNNIDWRALILISGGCNLNCRYCLVNKSKSGTNYPDFLKDTNEAIGFCGIKEIQEGVYEECGICVTSFYQGKGYSYW